MNQHALTVLEFPALLDNICEYAQSNYGINLIKSLSPSSDIDVIRRNRGIYSDMIAIRNRPLDVPSLRIEDINEILRHVAPEGAIIDGIELVTCLGVLDIAAGIRDFVDSKDCENFTALHTKAEKLDPCNELRAVLTRSLDRDGSVLDNASEKLKMLRREVASLELRIQRRLDQMVKSTDLDNTLQERFVTIRNGRYVVPVKKDSKAALPGIVHDLSNSGQTLFIEPAETLGWGNDLVRAHAEEREEVIRILADLSARLRSRLGAIMTDQKIISELDAAYAIAKWAGYFGCDLPEFSRRLKLENARHPLLLRQFMCEGKGRQVVPLNLEIRDGIKTIAITGSNTGGKTVVLKTVGLLCIAAQSGLPVPASTGSTFKIFDNILADIGDEQSIQADLSTFSAHMLNIASIIQECHHSSSLVLLDELGGGTDPVEGGAIACGIIENLAAGSSITITTTHLAMVKNYIHSRDNMLNASVRFDVNTLRPEYILDVGRPGASHALQIAKRLGMPKSILDSAQKMLTEDQIKLEDMLTRMEADQRRIAGHAKKMAGVENELTAKRDALKQELDELRNQRRHMLEEAHKQAEALVANTRRDMENLVRELRENAKHAKDAKASSEPDLAAIRNAIADKEKKIKAGLKIHAEKPQKPLKQDELHPGLRIWVEKMQAHGVIESISAKGNKIVVSVNGISVALNATDIQHNKDGKDHEANETVVKIIRPKATGETSSELNLIGMRVEDAINVLGAFLDRSTLLHMPELRIIHGFGTGRLRNGIHEYLQNHPAVRSFHLGVEGKDSGAGGCTIVKLEK